MRTCPGLPQRSFLSFPLTYQRETNLTLPWGFSDQFPFDFSLIRIESKSALGKIELGINQKQVANTISQTSLGFLVFHQKTNENQRVFFGFSKSHMFYQGFSMFSSQQTNKLTNTNNYRQGDHPPLPRVGRGGSLGCSCWISLVCWFVGLKTLKNLDKTDGFC